MKLQHLRQKSNVTHSKTNSFITDIEEMSEKSKSSFGTDSDHDSEEDAKEKATAFDQLILSQRLSQASKEPRRSSAELKIQKQEQEKKKTEARKTLFSQRTFGSGIMPEVTGAKVALDQGENNSVEDMKSSSSDENDTGDNAQPQAIVDDIDYFGPTAI